jgi:hypothetical protein
MIEYPVPLEFHATFNPSACNLVMLACLPSIKFHSLTDRSAETLNAIFPEGWMAIE